MSKYEKLLIKLLDHRSTISWLEIKFLLVKIGYLEIQKGKTSGSRVAFIHKSSRHIIRIHRPHPGNELKEYVKRAIIEELKNNHWI